MRRKSQRDEVAPAYHGTTRDVPVAPLPAFQEPYIFPKYLTDDTRELSYLENPELLGVLAEGVLAAYEGLRGVEAAWQQAFDFALADVEEFPEVRRRVFILLPDEIQREVSW